MTMVQTCYSGSDTVCGNPSNIHMDISRIVREIEEEVDMSDTIIAIGTEGENVTVIQEIIAFYTAKKNKP